MIKHEETPLSLDEISKRIELVIRIEKEQMDTKKDFMPKENALGLYFYNLQR
jgi:hypothetical protein